ncbi:MAG: serine hydrolase [Planctomycetes bacterium]|nr:serine hydrolase [Planctomycetota bacterium]
MSEATVPGIEWAQDAPEAAGLDGGRLDEAKRAWEAWADGRDYRVAIVRGGRLAAHWCRGVDPAARPSLASAGKSVFSTVLGIAVAEGKIGSADDRVVDYYPEMMDVPDGAGPKPGRHACPKDRDITFRQLISNTSGYLKPDEQPGRIFHYQTFGMNILCHAIATRYGLYDSRDPQRLPGISALIEEKIARPIGAQWTYHTWNFDHPGGARTGIFGNYTSINSTAPDMARLGLLWLRRGRWGDRRIAPADWVDQATRVAAPIREHESPENQVYGLGFWTNETGRLWPNLPADSYAARGAGRQLIWVCPSADLVVIESPGLYEEGQEHLHLLGDVLAAVT